MVDALAKVGLTAALRHRQPGQISGGQRQRVSIARALAADPKLLLCDEPVSALDASNRNYILRLLGGLRDSLGLPIVIISHDLSSLAGIADRVVVLYRGRIVEDGPVDQVFTRPRHPYTALLMASAPRVETHAGDPGGALSVHQLRRTTADPAAPAGQGACVFAARCPFAIDACAVQPALARGRARRGPATGPWPATGKAPGRHSPEPVRRRRDDSRARPPAIRKFHRSKAAGRNQLHARRVHRHDRHQGPVGDPGTPPGRSIDRDYVRASPAPTRTPASTGC